MGKGVGKGEHRGVGKGKGVGIGKDVGEDVALQDKMVYTLCAKFPNGPVMYCVLD